MIDERTSPDTPEVDVAGNGGVEAPPRKPSKKAVRDVEPPRKKSATIKKKKAAKGPKQKRRYTQRPYPPVPYREATQIGDAIFKFAQGDRIRRLTLLEKMERSPESGPTKQLITNSGKYGLTTGSSGAEHLELTDLGRVACDPTTPPQRRLEAQFTLAIDHISPFKLLYESYVGKKLPIHEVMKDRLAEEKALGVENLTECVDLFVVNVKDLGLLRTIAGAETLIPIEKALEDLGGPTRTVARAEVSGEQISAKPPASRWETICFYIAPIGTDGSESRKHSDLFLSILVEPALKELGLEVIRADKIGEPGMITTHILEHLKHSRLVVADLSLLNPNVFYEMAIRHAVRLPIVQIIRRADRLPFDVNQVNSVIIDNTDIYTFTPKIETYRSEITTLARRALDDPEHVGNPISVFYPDFWKS